MILTQKFVWFNHYLFKKWSQQYVPNWVSSDICWRLRKAFYCNSAHHNRLLFFRDLWTPSSTTWTIILAFGSLFFSHMLETMVQSHQDHGWWCHQKLNRLHWCCWKILATGNVGDNWMAQFKEKTQLGHFDIIYQRGTIIELALTMHKNRLKGHFKAFACQNC